MGFSWCVCSNPVPDAITPMQASASHATHICGCQGRCFRKQCHGWCTWLGEFYFLHLLMNFEVVFNNAFEIHCRLSCLCSWLDFMMYLNYNFVGNQRKSMLTNGWFGNIDSVSGLELIQFCFWFCYISTLFGRCSDVCVSIRRIQTSKIYHKQWCFSTKRSDVLSKSYCEVTIKFHVLFI